MAGLHRARSDRASATGCTATDDGDRADWLRTYGQLKRLASAHLRRNAVSILSASTLVHEAYLRLARHAHLVFRDSNHYLHSAARAMRWIVVERLRELQQKKRGGGWLRVDLDLHEVGVQSPDLDADQHLALTRAIEKLCQMDPRGGLVVGLRAAGMDTEKIAAELQISERTVRRDLAYGAAWLRRELRESGC